MAIFNSASLDRGRGIHLGGIVALDSSVIMPEYLSNKLNGVVFYVPPRLYHVLYFPSRGFIVSPSPLDSAKRQRYNCHRSHSEKHTEASDAHPQQAEYLNER